VGLAVDGPKENKRKTARAHQIKQEGEDSRLGTEDRGRQRRQEQTASKIHTKNPNQCNLIPKIIMHKHTAYMYI